MAKNYKALANNVRARINPENLIFEKAYRDDIGTVSYSDILVYVRTAMKAVPEEYTKRSKEAGERVKEHLAKELKSVSYKYQGSVMTNTHIRGASDIDLLVITEKYYQWNGAEVRNILNNFAEKSKYNSAQIQLLEKELDYSSYQGDDLQDLRDIRMDGEKVLQSVYSICDTSKPKAIKIHNLNLKRDVDTVVANWYDSSFSIAHGKGENRAVQIYNKAEHSRGPANYPFLSIFRINERSSNTNGRLKRMIRFLKNVKTDSDYEIDLNSFDINAICYDISTSMYHNASFYELVPVIYKQLKSICEDSTHADSLRSVVGTEYIFRYNQNKLKALRQLLSEVEGIANDLGKEYIYA